MLSYHTSEIKVNGQKIDDGYKDAIAGYNAKNTQFVGLKPNRNTDQDILDSLNHRESKQGANKAAVRYFFASPLPSHSTNDRNFPGGSQSTRFALPCAPFAVRPNSEPFSPSKITPCWENSIGSIPHLKSP